MTEIANLTAKQPSLDDIAAALATLRASSDHKVISKLVARDVFNEDDGSAKKVLMVIDTETTGLDPLVDKVIEIGYVMVEYSPETGKLYRVLDRVNEMQDPGFALSETTIKLTGIVDADVKDKSFNRTKIDSDIAAADLVMAHNSSFDRKMMEAEFPSMKTKSWVCSMANGPWEDMNIGSKKLEFLAYMVGSFYYEAHRATTDANAVLELLDCAGPDGKTILMHVLERGSDPSFTVWANGSAFETKDLLKANGYRWCAEADAGKFKAWFKEGVKDADAEMAFLAENIYTRTTKIAVDLILPEDAYSSRYTERQPFDIEPKKKPSVRP